MNKEIVKAKVGDVFVFSLGHGDLSFEIKPACEIDNGKWLCATCGIALQNQMQRDSHFEQHPKHKFAWQCFEHGVEVP